MQALEDRCEKHQLADLHAHLFGMGDAKFWFGQMRNQSEMIVKDGNVSKWEMGQKARFTESYASLWVRVRIRVTIKHQVGLCGRALACIWVEVGVKVQMGL